MVKSLKTGLGARCSVILLISLLFFMPQLRAQVAGTGIYRFLDLTTSASMASLGGCQIATPEPDISVLTVNPALLTDTMSNQLSLNYGNYLAGIGVGYVAYAPRMIGRNHWAAGIQYVNYGTFQGASETGVLTGQFTAAEYAFQLTYSRQVTRKIRLGVAIKPLYSVFESYHSYGVVADLGATYCSADQRFQGAVVLRNLGRQITPYYSGAVPEAINADLQIGGGYAFPNTPLRLLATFDQLNHWNNLYVNSQGEPLSIDPQKVTTQLMSHLILGSEVNLLPILTLRTGYNYKREKELALDSRPGLVGFSIGMGLKLGSFRFNYGVSSYHLSETIHYFSLTTNLGSYLH